MEGLKRGEHFLIKNDEGFLGTVSDVRGPPTLLGEPQVYPNCWRVPVGKRLWLIHPEYRYLGSVKEPLVDDFGS